MSSTVLGPRDTNVQMNTASPEKKAVKPETKSLEVHRQELASKLQNSDKTQQYISPSDSIQSPATAKLRDFREKLVLKKTKPKRMLFGNTSVEKMESRQAISFAPLPKKEVSPNDTVPKVEDAPLNDTPPAAKNDIPSQTGAIPQEIYSRDLNKSPAFELKTLDQVQQPVASGPEDLNGPEDLDGSEERNDPSSPEQKKA